jgi:hypothetical protein
MKFVTSFPLGGNGTDFREFGYTSSSDDISGCWIAVKICVSGARHNIVAVRIREWLIIFLYIKVSVKFITFDSLLDISFWDIYQMDWVKLEASCTSVNLSS